MPPDTKSNGFAWLVSQWPVIRFSLMFGILLFVFYAWTSGLPYDRFLADYLQISAQISSRLINFLGQKSLVSGLTIESSSFAFTVQRGCDAIEPSWFYLVAVLAFPSRFWRKIPGILVGVVVLNILNLIRISTLFLVGTYHPSLFNTLHLEVWPALFIILSILLWLSWVRWTKGDDAKN